MFGLDEMLEYSHVHSVMHEFLDLGIVIANLNFHYCFSVFYEKLVRRQGILPRNQLINPNLLCGYRDIRGYFHAFYYEFVCETFANIMKLIFILIIQDSRFR